MSEKPIYSATIWMRTRQSSAPIDTLRTSLPEILRNRADEISPRMRELIVDLHEDWLRLDARIEAVTHEIGQISRREKSCQKLMTVPGIGPLVSTAMVAAVGRGEAFERGRDFGAWLGLIPRQYSTGGRPILGRLSKRGSKYLRSLHSGRQRDPDAAQDVGEVQLRCLAQRGLRSHASQQAGGGAGQQARAHRLERPAAQQEV